MRKLLLLVVIYIVLGFAILQEPTPYNFPPTPFFPNLPTNTLNPTTEEGVMLGRYLFYDTILSKNYDMSCGSCHKQAAAFSNGPNQFSIGHNGIPTKRNTLPLFNLAWNPAFFWDGRAATLEAQVFHPVRDSNEMNLEWKIAEKRIRKSHFYQPLFKAAFGNQLIDSTLISKAIAQFLRTLISNQSKFDKALERKDSLNLEEYEGFVLVNNMVKGDCLHCHLTDGNALTTIGQFSNNGLDTASNALNYKDIGYGNTTGLLKDYGKFRTPSFRNLVFTAPYMHDGRFATLEQVLDFYSEGVHASVNVDSKMSSARLGGVYLTQDEKKKIIAFLHTFTDSSFVENKNFSNPFTN